jgi:hypothetical protein
MSPREDCCVVGQFESSQCGIADSGQNQEEARTADFAVSGPTAIDNRQLIEN